MTELQRCHGCGFVDDVILMPVKLYGGRVPSLFVFPDTSIGTIMVCDLCFESELAFRDLSESDKADIRWHFGSAFADDGDPERAIELLAPFLAESRVPDTLSPMGRALIRAGRRDEGIPLLREALDQFPHNPYRNQDREFLERA